MDPSGEPPTLRTVDTYVSERLYPGEDDPSSQPSFFELGKAIVPPATSNPASSSAALGPDQPVRDVRGSSHQTPTSLGSDQLPMRDEGACQPSTSTGPSHFFSSKRSDAQGRRFFSDTRPKASSSRPRPDVSAIYQHLGMTLPSGASVLQPSPEVSKAGGRVAFAEASPYHPTSRPYTDSSST